MTRACRQCCQCCHPGTVATATPFSRRRGTHRVQAAHNSYGERALMQLMPGVFGLEDVEASASEAVNALPPTVVTDAGSAAFAADVQSSLAIVEAERGKLQRKEEQLERTTASILKSLEKLTDQLHAA